MNELFEYQQQLTSVIAPSGHEGIRAKMIAELVRPYVDEVYTDVMGNLIAHKKGSGSKVMIAAHMDTLGFVVERIDEKGFLKVFPIGGVPVYALDGKRLLIEGGIAGTITSEPKANIRNKDLRSIKIEHFFVDIGARDRSEAEAMVTVGACAAYSISPEIINQTILHSSYCDDLMGCSTLISAIRHAKTPTNDMYYVFTVQEEVGCRGAQPAAERIRPDVGVVVEVVGAEDIFSRRKDSPRLRLGKGPVLRAYDGRTIYDAGLLTQISEAGQKVGHPCQIKYSAGGANDASVIQKAGVGARLASLCMATRYIHSQSEMLDLRDAAGVRDILLALETESFSKE